MEEHLKTVMTAHPGNVSLGNIPDQGGSVKEWLTLASPVGEYLGNRKELPSNILSSYGQRNYLFHYPGCQMKQDQIWMQFGLSLKAPCMFTLDELTSCIHCWYCCSCRWILVLTWSLIPVVILSMSIERFSKVQNAELRAMLSDVVLTLLFKNKLHVYV